MNALPGTANTPVPLSGSYVNPFSALHSAPTSGGVGSYQRPVNRRYVAVDPMTGQSLVPPSGQSTMTPPPYSYISPPAVPNVNLFNPASSSTAAAVPTEVGAHYQPSAVTAGSYVASPLSGPGQTSAHQLRHSPAPIYETGSHYTATNSSSSEIASAPLATTHIPQATPFSSQPMVSSGSGTDASSLFSSPSRTKSPNSSGIPPLNSPTSDGALVTPAKVEQQSPAKSVPPSRSIQRTYTDGSAASASELFSRPSPAAQGAPAASPFSSSDIATVFAARPNAEPSVIPASVSPPKTMTDSLQDGNASHPKLENDEDEMDDVPLSPDGVMLKATSAAAVASAESTAVAPGVTNPLFSAIGMPPPPYQSKK
jgi:hypothetical protein